MTKSTAIVAAFLLVLAVSMISPASAFRSTRRDRTAWQCENNYMGGQSYCCPLQQLPPMDENLFEISVPQSIHDQLSAQFPEGSHPHGSFLANQVGVLCEATNGCNVNVTWLKEGAGYRNVFGYYFYDTTTRNIKDGILYPAFPDTSALGSKGCLEYGDTLHLPHQIGKDETLAFFLRANGANNTPTGNTAASTWYSTTDYFSVGGLRNDDGFDIVANDGITPTKHFGWVQFEDRLIFGCEDLNLGAGNADRDYNDVMFLINIDGDWDDTYVPNLNCTGDDCTVYKCEATTVTYTGTEFTADVEITYEGREGIHTADFDYSWVNGGWTVDSTSTSQLEVHTYDTICTTEHDGEYLYSEGDCGCEETFIEANQPQLFVESASSYYNTPGTLINNFEGIAGLSVYHYTGAASDSFVTDLYLKNDGSDPASGTIYRADFNDGRTLRFSNVVYSAPENPVAISPPDDGCKCRRALNVILLLEKSGEILGAGYAHVKTFVEELVKDFDISSTGVTLGITEYNANSINRRLQLSSGHVKNNVDTVVAGSLSCSSPVQPCHSTNAAGDLSKGLKRSIDDHLAFQRNAKKLIIVVTNGWEGSLTTQLNRAADNNISVLAVTYGSKMTIEEQRAITYANGAEFPDNIVFRYQALDLSTEPVIDVSSRACLVADSPCGTNCDAVCDTACNSCNKFDKCEESKSCTKEWIIPAGGVFCVEVNRAEDACQVVIENGVVVEGLPAPASLCQSATCTDGDIDSPLTCTYKDDCVSDVCYLRTCELQGTEYICQETLRTQPDACNEVECIYDNDGVATELRVTAVTCQPESPCHTAECVVSSGGCVSTPIPDPTVNACEPHVCGDDGWEVSPVSCTTSDICSTSKCVEVDGQAECILEPVCTSDDLCVNNVCDPDSGTCSEESACEHKVCQVLVDCVAGQCSYEPKQCTSPDHPCEDYACVNDECVKVSDERCSICDPPCENNECFLVPCEMQVCQTDSPQSKRDCAVANNECLIGTCDNDQGCVYENVNCDDLVPSNACREFVADSSHPGCCKEVDKVCTGDDACTIYGCDTLTGCTAVPKVCDLDPCKVHQTGEGIVNGCLDGVCLSEDRDCSTDGCETTHCNVETDSCEILNWDLCECTCDNTACINYNCVRGECQDPVTTECDVQHVCQVNPRCDDTLGCLVDEVDCSLLTPPPCMEYYRDPTHPDTCCQLRPVTCVSETCEEVACVEASNSCEVVSRENCPCETDCVVNRCERNECQYNPETLFPECVRVSTTTCTAPDQCYTNARCDPDAPEDVLDGCLYDKITCDDLTPDACFDYIEDPLGVHGDECCVQRPRQCPSDTCAILGCVTTVDPVVGTCEIVDNTPCECDPVECVNNKCVRHDCDQGVCGDEVLTVCTPPDTCHINPRCDPEAEGDGCLFDEVVCPTPPPCKVYKKDPTAEGCCVLEDLVCTSETCETFKCDNEDGSDTLGECILDSRAACPCDLDRHDPVQGGCYINNKCQTTPCVEGECGEPTFTECTASDFCHTNPRCDPSAEGDGCLEDEVDCGEPAPCTTWEKDPSNPDCCVAVPVKCVSQGCEELECNVSTNSCQIVSTENCLCVCPNNVCETTPCLDIIAGTCGDTVVKDCPAPDFCRLPGTCVIEQGGCVYEDVVCPESPEPCKKYVRDPEYDGTAEGGLACCKLVDVECPTGDDKCMIYETCDTETNTCPVVPKTCTPPTPCLEIHTDYTSTGGCNPNNGECVFQPKSCPTTDCYDRECNPDNGGSCDVISDARCSICDPPCTNNKCVLTQCVEATCDVDNAVVTDCETVVADDTCTISTGCDPETGCTYESVDCSNVEHNACQRVVKDSTHEGCCKIVDIDCEGNDPCRSYSCDAELGCQSENLCVSDSPCQASICQDDGCALVPRLPHACPENPDKCITVSCSETFECVEEPVVCASDDLCVVPTCDSETGACSFPPKDCDDGNPCTIDTCDNGECVHTDKDCTGGDMCITGVCDTETGECSITPVVCDDGVECTIDKCDSSVGCVNTADDARCSSQDICQISGGCDVNQGCIFTPRECPDDGDFCTSEYCKPFEGCLVEIVDCSIDENNNTKNATIPNECGVIHFCDSEESTCKEEAAECVGFFTEGAIVATALGTAAIVGIVVGVILAFALCAGGAGVYSVYKNTETEAEASVGNNPLYEGSSTGGANPLFKE